MLSIRNARVDGLEVNRVPRPLAVCSSQILLGETDGRLESRGTRSSLVRWIGPKICHAPMPNIVRYAGTWASESSRQQIAPFRVKSRQDWSLRCASCIFGISASNIFMTLPFYYAIVPNTARAHAQQSITAQAVRRSGVYSSPATTGPIIHTSL